MIRGPISRSARPVFRRLRLAVGILFALVIAVPNPRHGGAQTASVSTAEAAQGLSGLTAWRSQREMEVSAPDGWLKTGVNSVGSAADNQIRLRAGAPDHLGMLTVVQNATGQVVQLLSPAGGFPAGLTTDGKPAREGSLDVDGANPTKIAWQGISLTVLKRGDRFVLRIKDSASPDRAGFRGLKWFAPDARYRVTARWVPFKPPQVLEIPTVIGTTLKLPAPGIAMFVLNGMVVHLEPVIEDPAKQTLFFILRDSTSESTTYPGGRFLHTGLPDHGLDKPGSLILDFNRLENPPCAYTVYATCPLPPEMNKLPIAVEAGERLYER
jgi:hypothetical protein